MRLNLTKKWFEKEIASEKETNVTAGVPNVEPFLTEADEYRQAQLRKQPTGKRSQEERGERKDFVKPRSES